MTITLPTAALVAPSAGPRAVSAPSEASDVASFATSLEGAQRELATAGSGTDAGDTAEAGTGSANEREQSETLDLSPVGQSLVAALVLVDVPLVSAAAGAVVAGIPTADAPVASAASADDATEAATATDATPTLISPRGAVNTLASAPTGPGSGTVPVAAAAPLGEIAEPAPAEAVHAPAVGGASPTLDAVTESVARPGGAASPPAPLQLPAEHAPTASAPTDETPVLAEVDDNRAPLRSSASAVPASATSGEGQATAPLPPADRVTPDAAPERPVADAATAVAPDGPDPLAPVTIATPRTAETVAPAPVAAPARTMGEQLVRPLLTLRTAPNGEHVFTVRVTPEALGPVTVRAHVSADGVRIELVAANDQAREALKSLLPDLRRDLSQGGLGASLDLASGQRETGRGELGDGASDRGAETGERPAGSLRPSADLAPAQSPRARYSGASTSIDVLA